MHSYVCLFSTKLGYSLSTTPNVICNFLSMNDVSGATLENPDSTIHQSECSFVVQVHPSGDDDANAASNHDERSKFPNNAETSGNIACTVPESGAGDTAVKEARLGPKPYHLQASSIAERDQWINAINTALRTYQRNKEERARQRGSALSVCQLRLRSFYTGLPFQTSTALLVAVNFVVTVSAPAVIAA